MSDLAAGIVIVISLILFFVVAISVSEEARKQSRKERAATKLAQERLAKVANPVGMSSQAIIRYLGPPTEILSFHAGFELLSWKTRHYHISLEFQNGVCARISFLQSDFGPDEVPIEADPFEHPPELDKFSFDCPACHTKLTIDKTAIGKKVRCPYCERVYPFPPPD